MKNLLLPLSVIITYIISSSFIYPDEEQRLKFLYIKNFIKNIEWPENSVKKEFKIAVYGNKKIYDKISFSNIKPEHANGRSISYYFFTSTKRISDCQVIYVPMGFEDELSEIISLFRNKPALIISDSPGACEKGAAINFIKLNKDKIGFEYNLKAFEQSGLKYSSSFMEQGNSII